MSLTSCLDCGRQVSVRAETCPSCGAPLLNPSIALGTHVVIERTGRRWKKMRVGSVVIALVGGVLCATPLAPLGVLLILFAVGRALWSRVGAWWTNG